MIDNTPATPPATYTRENYLKTIADAYAPEDCEQCEVIGAACWECAEEALAEQGMEPDAFA